MITKMIKLEYDDVPRPLREIYARTDLRVLYCAKVNDTTYYFHLKQGTECMGQLWHDTGEAFALASLDDSDTEDILESFNILYHTDFSSWLE